MKDKDLVSYLNSIDFSLINNSQVLNNVYKEILPNISELSKDPFASTSLEKLIGLSDSSNLLNLLSKVNKNVIHKKLGSRIIESVYKRLFDCLYKENEFFLLESAIEFLNISECLDCHNATFVVRQALMLLSGKRIEKLEITKYKIPDTENKNDSANPNGSSLQNPDVQSSKSVTNQLNNVNEKNQQSNTSYSQQKLSEIKDIFIKKLPSFDSNDQFNTLGTFIQVTKSQSLIELFLERDCSFENIVKKGFLYELIPTVASKKNLALIFYRIENCIMDLALNEKSSYFIQSFLRNSCYGKEICRSLNFEEFDCDSNVIIALLESLQLNYMKNTVKITKNKNNLDDSNGNVDITNMKSTNQLLDKSSLKNLTELPLIKLIISEFYKLKDDTIFETLLLEKYGSLDSKYIKVVSNFMLMPSEFSYNCNLDFLRFFSKSWIKSKGGIQLIEAFAAGSCERSKKMKFFNENIDLFRECFKWKNSKEFITRLCDLTNGHSRKKAFEILKKLKQISQTTV